MTQIKPASPLSLNGTVVVVCHNRPRHLQIVIEQLRSAQDYELYKVIVVHQLGNEDVSSVIDSGLPSAKVYRTKYDEKVSIRARINANVYKGLLEAFRDPNCDFAVVLEDDIVVANDFLWFVRFVIWKMYNDEDFRAVNGFSRMKSKPFRKNFTLGYVRLNYGAGWGWAVKRDTFISLQNLWHGDEDDHWDGLIEDYLRTGFVVNPLVSRIMNIGLEGTGTHGGVDANLESEIADSFENQIIDLSYKPFHEKISVFEWRSDCYNHSVLPIFIVKLQMLTWKIVSKMKCLHLCAIRSGNEFSKILTSTGYSIGHRCIRNLQKQISKMFLSKSSLDS